MEAFETERLLVRQFRHSDADDFFLFNSSESVMRYIRPLKNREESDAFLEETLNLYLEGFPYGRMHVSEKSSGKFVGSFSVLYLDGEADYHVGYALLEAFWGLGYASELLCAGTQMFFEKTIHPSLYAITQQKNIASEKLLLKNGYHRDGNFMLQDQSLLRFRFSRNDLPII